MKVLASLIVNKVTAFGTAGCSSDDVLHFVQGQAKVDIKLRLEHLHTSYSEPSNNLGALKGKHGLFLCEVGECAHCKARTWMT